MHWTDHGYLGKTTLVSSVVDWFLDQAADFRDSGCSISYFYFKHDQPDKRTHKSLLRAVLDQLITQEVSLSHELLDEFSSIDSCQLSIDRLQRYAQIGFASYQTSYIIVDGIDECSKDEARKSVNWLLSLSGARSGELNGMVKVLVAGQQDGVLDVLLASQPAISLSASSHSADIRQYCEEISKDIQVKFSISDALKDFITYQVTDGAQGNYMFLCVRFAPVNVPYLRHVPLRKVGHAQSPTSTSASGLAPRIEE